MIENDIYKITISKVCANISILILISLVVSIVPLMLSAEDAIFFTSQPLYIAVLLLFVTTMYYRQWGLVIAAVTFAICSFNVNLDVKDAITNSTINVFQIFLLLLSYTWLKKLKIKNNNLYSNGRFFISLYNYLLLLIFIGYLSYSTMTKAVSTPILYVFSLGLALITICKSIIEKDGRLVFYTVTISFMPSFIASSVSAILSRVPTAIIFDYISVWTLSNYILLQTAGYLMYQIFYSRKKIFDMSRKLIEIDLSCLLFYVAILAWNILMIWMICNKTILFNSYIYFFPWILGNLFLIMNLYFCSNHTDANAGKDKFAWYENRVIVVEKNTNTLIMVISFILPFSFNLLREIPPILPILFIADIFCSCISIGLIWTPKANIKFISLLKSIKTIFYTFSITLLMLCVIIVMSYIQ
jgi:hypothetical protein